MSLARKLGVIIARANLSEKARAQFARFLGSCGDVIARADGAIHVAAALESITSGAGAGTGAAVDAMFAVQIARTMSDAAPSERAAYARVHSAPVPVSAHARIARAFREVPALDGLIEFAQHSERAVMREMNIARRLHLEGVEVRVGVTPSAREWPARAKPGTTRYDSMFVNALGMRGVTHLIVRGIDECIDRDARIFAMIAHDSDVEIASRYVCARAIVGSTTLSALTGNEKRAISVSDVMSPAD